MKLFNYDIHIGKFRVLVQTRDINDKAVTSEKIADRAVRWWHIAKKAIRNEHIDDEAVDERTIKKGAVKDRHIGKGEIHPNKFAPCVETEWLNPKLNAKCECMMKQIAELRQLVTSYTANGVALSNCLGANQDIGITQWRLTKELVALNKRINDALGFPDKGICVKITPEVFISETTGEVTLTVTSQEDIMEKVKVLVNDEVIIEKSMTEGFIDHFTLSDTSVVKTIVQIMGVEYTDIKVVTKLFPFFIGSGNIYTDAINVDNARQFKGHLRGSYDITVHETGQKMYVIFPAYLSDQVIRIDMNGYEIPMTISRHEYDGTEYTVYESTNTYTAGRYNIDITNNCNCHCGEDCQEEND